MKSERDNHGERLKGDHSMQFMGYRRKDGQVGVRNYIVVVSTVMCSSTVANKIADATGVNVVTHESGCGQLGPDKEHTERVLAGVVTHPNIGAVLSLGLGCEQVDGKALAAKAKDHGKAAEYLSIHESGGNQKAVESGIKLVEKLKTAVAGAKREQCHASELILATQCGSSDTGSGLAANPVVGDVADRIVKTGGTVLLGETGSLYGAAGVMAKRAITQEIGEEIVEITNVRERFYARMGKSIREANPTPGNIAGGLTTLVEKSLGGVRKGGTYPIRGVLKPGEKVDGKGLWIMDTSLGLGACALSDMLSSGAQIMAYTTGRGNPLGSAIAPVVKITSTKTTADNLVDIIDFDASPVLLSDEGIEECGLRLFDEILAVAGGKQTKAEISGNLVFAIGKIAI